MTGELTDLKTTLGNVQSSLTSSLASIQGDTSCFNTLEVYMYWPIIDQIANRSIILKPGVEGYTIQCYTCYQRIAMVEMVPVASNP